MRLFLAVLLIIPLGGGAQPSILIQNIQWLDVEGQTFNRGDIYLEDGVISSLGKIQGPVDDVITIDGTGKFLIPGLIDAHIHLFQSGGIYTRPDAIDLTRYRPYDEEIQWVRDNAGDFLSRYLKCGITSVMDIGGPMSNFDIRQEFKDDHLKAQLFTTGPLISTYQPPAFAIEDPPIIKVNSKQEAINLVEQQTPYRPDFIKIWYINLPALPAESTYEIVKATIEKCHANSLRVAVHATELNTAKLSLKAGADVLVHSVRDHPIDEDFLKLLKANDAVYIPTLVVGGNYGKAFTGSLELGEADFSVSPPIPLGSLDHLRHLAEGHLQRQMIEEEKEFSVVDNERRQVMYANLKLLQDQGVKIATGTDAGNIGTLHASSFYHEIGAMKAAGLSNAQIIKASTIGGAHALGRASEIGSIEVGKRADLVLLNANPLADLNALQDIHLLLNRGYLLDPDTLARPTPEHLVQQQLNGYNQRNIEAFLAPYAENVELYGFPNNLLSKGKEDMRASYSALFENAPELHCQLVNRMIQGNTVIDHERVTGLGSEPLEAIAIYKITSEEISKVYFIHNPTTP